MSEPFVHWDNDDVPKLSMDGIGDRTAQEGAPSLEELQQHYPRTVFELRVLECLRRMFPLALAPQQLALLLHVDVQDIRAILTALKLVGVIENPGRAMYRHLPV